eukprot:XP_001700045.1 predicted protein [Chlamydomonas reinhardtii]
MPVACYLGTSALRAECGVAVCVSGAIAWPSYFARVRVRVTQESVEMVVQSMRGTTPVYRA